MRAWCSELSLGSLFRPASKDSLRILITREKKTSRVLGLMVPGDATLPRPCTVAGPGSPFPPPHNPPTDPPPPTLHHQFVPRLIPHFFQPHAPLAPPTPFSTTLGHALGPRTSAAHGDPAPRTEFCSSREASFAVARTATPPLQSYGPERDRGRDELSREKGGLP